MTSNTTEIKPLQILSYLSIFIVAPVATYHIGKWFDNTLGFEPWPSFPFNLLGLAVIVTGAVIGIRSTRELYREGFGLPWGEANEKAQSRQLVITGPYAYTRNPMVLGYSMLPLGMGIIFQSFGMSFGFTSIILLINIVIVKLIEEPGMEKRFGETYLVYKKYTPFLIPKLPDPRCKIELSHHQDNS